MVEIDLLKKQITNLLNMLGMGEREKDADECECVCDREREIPGVSWWRGEKEKPTWLWQKFLALPRASCATRKLKRVDQAELT